MRTTAALISTAALMLTLAACSDGSGDSGSPADSATASSPTATTAPPADAEAIRACMASIDALYTGDWSPTTPPKTRPADCESLSVTEYGYAYRSAVAAIAKAGEDFYNDNAGLPTDWPS
ncbi:hypothetical protein OIE43_00555 [Streptomyces pseudovenezuelae]|uniref:hypothetical protein n=2 Tax=Streptomyces pseudovenezuelae TaxID=67350 RepID=UPI002E37FFE7|nr:hypothetical protein [Streptomyces pseudovenezuelae]